MRPEPVECDEVKTGGFSVGLRFGGRLRLGIGLRRARPAVQSAAGGEIGTSHRCSRIGKSRFGVDHDSERLAIGHKLVTGEEDVAARLASYGKITDFLRTT